MSNCFKITLNKASQTEETQYFANAHQAWKQWQEYRKRDLDGQDYTVTALYTAGTNLGYNPVAFLRHSFTAAEDSPLFVPRDTELEPLFYAAQGFEAFWKTARVANNKANRLDEGGRRGY